MQNIPTHYLIRNRGIQSKNNKVKRKYYLKDKKDYQMIYQARTKPRGVNYSKKKRFGYKANH